MRKGRGFGRTQNWSDIFKAKWAFGQQRSSSAGGIGRSGGSLGAMEAVSAGAGAPPPPGDDRWEELCSMEAALEAEVSELRLTVASPTSVGTVGTVGRVVEAESEGDENTSPSRDLRSDSSYWGSRGQNRRAVRRADVSGVAPVREEGDYEKRFEVTQRLSPKPAMTRPARRGGRDAGAPVAKYLPAIYLPSSRNRNGAASTGTTACACLGTTLRSWSPRGPPPVRAEPARPGRGSSARRPRGRVC